MQSIYKDQKKKKKDKQPWMQLELCMYLWTEIYMRKDVFIQLKKKRFLSKSFIYLSDAAEGVRQRHLVLTDVNAPTVIVHSMLQTPGSAPSCSKIGTARCVITRCDIVVTQISVLCSLRGSPGWMSFYLNLITVSFCTPVTCNCI